MKTHLSALLAEAGRGFTINNARGSRTIVRLIPAVGVRGRVSDFLLDTHALMWAINEPNRLGPGVAQASRVLENRLLVSAASSWEPKFCRWAGSMAG
ncbi:hypothetical protein [Actinomyces ruminis]|uniref:hypothetical protein n=1 Tax=Actinomyces ruminis TaxID=1937003 RepID=UPI00211DB761|nr:hypothetical protein [Actinomyces ruminis]